MWIECINVCFKLEKKQKKTYVKIWLMEEIDADCRGNLLNWRERKKEMRSTTYTHTHTHTLFTGRCHLEINNISKEWLFCFHLYIKKNFQETEQELYTEEKTKEKSVDRILFFQSTRQRWSSCICPSR
jgi:hypothetical protein